MRARILVCAPPWWHARVRCDGRWCAGGRQGAFRSPRRGGAGGVVARSQRRPLGQCGRLVGQAAQHACNSIGCPSKPHLKHTPTESREKRRHDTAPPPPTRCAHEGAGGHSRPRAGRAV